MKKMIPMEIRKIIVADYDDGMKVEFISWAVRVSASAIYRLLEKRQKTGTIKPYYENSGKQAEVTPDKLTKMKTLIAENPDITLAEIKKPMRLIFPDGVTKIISALDCRTLGKSCKKHLFNSSYLSPPKGPMSKYYISGRIRHGKYGYY